MYTAIIILTVIVSFLCFNNYGLMENLKLSPYAVIHKREWYRVITHGFVHADLTHLLINMFVLWSFGSYVSDIFKAEYMYGGMNYNFNFLFLYFGGLVAASIYDLIKRRNDPYYASIGASGAVSAVVFASIFYNPTGLIYLFMVIPMPGIIFGLLYLGYESYSSRRTGDRINHHAHIFGAVFGFLYPVITGQTYGFTHFFENLKIF